jgi:hypothetical protein
MRGLVWARFDIGTFCLPTGNLDKRSDIYLRCSVCAIHILVDASDCKSQQIKTRTAAPFHRIDEHPDLL